MSFATWEFLGFLAVLFLLYHTLPVKCRKPLLLAASLAFYACAGWEGLCFILTTALTSYFAALGMDRIREEQEAYIKAHKELTREEKKAKRAAGTVRLRRILAICLLFNLAILLVVKYADFFLSSARGLFGLEQGRPLGLIMPLGISFYTLQVTGYLVDVYRGTVRAEKSLWKHVLFVSFFPQVIQGPISRYGDLSKTLFNAEKTPAKEFFFGLERILWGFFKKLVIADRLAIFVGKVIGDPGTYRGPYVLLAMILYTLELYADFTGGIDITIGTAQALGIRVAENFNLPYFSTSLKEYWRRWHISMCSWFRDYVFYPVSTSRFMRRFTGLVRGRLGDKAARKLPLYLASLAVWFCTGLWHGANWNFIVWGLLNWAILMISQELEPLYDRFHKRFAWSNTAPYRVFMILRTFIFIICTMNLFDCYATVGETFGAFGSLFTAGGWQALTDGSMLKLGLSAVDFIVLAFSLLLVLLVSLKKQRKGSVRELLAQRPFALQLMLWGGLLLCIILFGIYGIGYDASQFIYNRF